MVWMCAANYGAEDLRRRLSWQPAGERRSTAWWVWKSAPTITSSSLTVSVNSWLASGYTCGAGPLYMASRAPSPPHRASHRRHGISRYVLWQAEVDGDRPRPESEHRMEGNCL